MKLIAISDKISNIAGDRPNRRTDLRTFGITVDPGHPTLATLAVAGGVCAREASDAAMTRAGWPPAPGQRCGVACPVVAPFAAARARAASVPSTLPSWLVS